MDLEHVVLDLPERVTKGDDVKLWRGSGELLHLDVPHLDLSNFVISADNNPVSLVNEDDVLIGCATLTPVWDNRIILSDLFARYDCPERLDLETGTKLYLHPKGWISELESIHGSELGQEIQRVWENPIKVKKIHISSVKVSSRPFGKNLPIRQ